MTSNEKIKYLFSWCVLQTKGYNNVHIKNFTSSWRNGLGFCAILHQYGPEYIDYDNLNADNVYENCQLAFRVGEKYFGIPALLDAKEMLELTCPDRLSVITYLTQCYATLTQKSPKMMSVTGGPLSREEHSNEDQMIETADSDSAHEQREQLSCQICSDVIYFLEKLSVNDKFYHRSCYRQTQLSNLKMRNATLERPKNNLPDEVHAVTEVIDRKSRSRSVSSDNDLTISTPREPKTEEVVGHARKLSLDDKVSLETAPSKSLSASSMNCISINASSTDVVSLAPSSMNTSRSSINSSSNKKRQAPLPPAPSLLSTKSSVAPEKTTMPRKTVTKPEPLYPEDLNPFAVAEEEQSVVNETNPFAEYMTEDVRVQEKPAVKPRKRVAPKVPVLLPPPGPSDEDRTPKDGISELSHSMPALPTPTSSSVVVPLPTNGLHEETVERSATVNKLELCLSPKDALHSTTELQGGKPKPPAPSRPLPLKREVRGDTSYELMPYDSLYLELEEVNRAQSDMESRGRAIQDSLNEVDEKEDRYESLLEEWLEVVEKKNSMYAREHHLHEILRRQELEDRHSDLEYELRVLMGKQESLKTATEKAREDELIHQILDIVNARAQLTEELAETPAKSSTNELPKKKNTLKKMFSARRRSSSLGKNLFPFKIPKNAEHRAKLHLSLTNSTQKR